MSRAVCLRATVKVQSRKHSCPPVHQFLSRQSRRGGKLHRDDALCVRARCIANKGGRDFCISPLNYSTVGDSFCALFIKHNSKSLTFISFFLSSFKLRFFIIFLILSICGIWFHAAAHYTHKYFYLSCDEMLALVRGKHWFCLRYCNLQCRCI
jgi:hypothetical protein